MNYTIIADGDELRNFIDWLPELEPWEQFYVTLFARKKYFPEHPALKHDKTQLKRFTATKKNLINKLWQLEVPIGAYRGADDLTVPQECLAVYISLNPRDLRKVFLKGIKHFAGLLEDIDVNPKNPRQEIMNVIQTTQGTKHYHVFDLDSKNLNLLQECREIVSGHCSVIQTRGGYHFLVNQSAVKEKLIDSPSWYMYLKNRADVVGDCLSPIPGTYQGGYCVRLIK
jgi:hypothetical protein